MRESDFAGADDRRSPKRKRIIESCSECRRRKQKCNRQRPCNHCLMRKVPRKCIFGNSLGSAAQMFGEEPIGMLGGPIEKDLGLESSTESCQTVSNLGYSSVAESNAFMGLKQIMHLEDEGLTSDHGQSHQIPHLSMNVRALVAKLPRRRIIDKLIAAFFANVNWHYDIVEKFYFDDIFLHWSASKPFSVKYLSPKELFQELRYFPALLFQVLAHSLQFLSPDAALLREMSESELISSQRYSDIGNEIMGLLGRQGLALTAVQADLLRSSLLKNVGRGPEAWFSLGNAIRQAQELGLHRHTDIRQTEDNVEATLNLVWYDEYRRRVWINLFVWDSLMALILGRPRAINQDDCDANLPIDCNIPSDPSKTLPMAVSIVGARAIPTSVSASLIRYSLAEKVHELRALKLDRPHPRDPSLIQSFHEQVISIVDNAPPLLRSKHPDTSLDTQYPCLPQQREELLTLANLFLMTLHRPHIVALQESRKAAFQAAVATLESQQRYFDQTEPHQYKLFSLSFYTIDAAILLSIITILYPPQSLDAGQQVDHILQQAINRLSVIEPYNKMSNSGLGILQHCYKKLKETLHLPGNTGTELQDLQRDLNSQDFSLLQDFGSGQYPPPLDQVGINLPNPEEMTEMTGDFQGTYWLEHINQIQSYPWIASDAEQTLNYVPFN